LRGSQPTGGDSDGNKARPHGQGQWSDEVCAKDRVRTERRPICLLRGVSRGLCRVVHLKDTKVLTKTHKEERGDDM